MDKEELINGYFEGSLSPHQLEEVERLLKTDSEFASELDFQKELQVSLKKEERQEMKAMFSDIADKNPEGGTKVFQLRPWLAAASIALLLGLGSWFFLFNNPDLNTNELYAANFKPYENVIHPIERGNQLEDLKTRAFIAYENEEYPKALTLFQELQSKQNDAYIDFYSAMVLMQLNKQEEAIPLLEGYMEREGELQDRASWYLALAYLKKEDLDSCKKELKTLVEKNGFKAKAAKNLLEQLN